MLFITNRVLQEGITPKIGDKLQVPRSVNFDLQDNQAEQSVYLCRRNSSDDYTEIGGQKFLSELRDSKAKEILLFVHGFSNLPESEIFPRAKELQELFDLKSNGHTIVVPVIWPCAKGSERSKKVSQTKNKKVSPTKTVPPTEQVGLIEEYFMDEMAADNSGTSFARLFQKFLDWRDNNSTIDNPCTIRINILAHSMGARVVRETFASTVKYFLPKGMPLAFRNIFLASADIVNEALEPGQEGQYISPATRNVVVYYAADDLAMRASKVANVGQIASRRMGHTGPEHMDKVNKNVYALDCNDFNTEYDPPTGHGYFAKDGDGNAGILFDHMWKCIETGRVPMEARDAKTTILPIN
jgi:esterase/lipase superfamily enzyme